jgi:hypothetical protein
MADKKISLLNSANALSGLEVLPIVQSGITKKVSILDLTDNKKVFQYVSQNLNSNPANISTRINALPNFTISQDQILGFKDFVYSGANLQRIDVYELKNIGKGNYGVGGTPITESNFEFITSQAINFNTVSTNPSNQVITISTLSGATISAFINAKTPPYVLQSSGDGLRIFDVTDGNVFIFNGVAGTYGSGNLQTVIGDFTVVPRENNVVLTEWEDVSGEIQNKLGKSVVVKNTSADNNDDVFFIKSNSGDRTFRINGNGRLFSDENIQANSFDTDGGFKSLNGLIALSIEAANAGFKSNKRINYETDLSATFTSRSLVDKAYADSKAALVFKSTTLITHTGTTAETLILTITIPANTLNANSILRLDKLRIFTDSTGNCTVKLKGSSTNSLSSAGLLATNTFGTPYGAMQRDFALRNNQIDGFVSYSSSSQDNLNSIYLPISGDGGSVYNTANDYYLFVSFQLASSSTIARFSDILLTKY